MRVHSAFVDLSHVFARRVVCVGVKVQTVCAFHPRFVCHVGKNVFDLIWRVFAQSARNRPLYSAVNKNSIDLLVEQVATVTKAGTCDVPDVGFLKEELPTGQPIFGGNCQRQEHAVQTQDDQIAVAPGHAAAQRTQRFLPAETPLRRRLSSDRSAL